MSDPTIRHLGIFQAIHLEETKAIAFHGEQRPTHLEWLSILTEEVGEAAECVNRACVRPVDPGIVDPALDNLEYELIQIASVCVRWVKMLRATHA